jgi:hypothetical protein
VKFVCDSTVGKLARLMRMAGFDTASVRTEGTAAVISVAREENRQILSRNSRFSELTMAPDFYHVTPDLPDRQFARLIVDLGLELNRAAFLTRCLDCNAPLQPVEKCELEEELFPYVRATQDSFHRCPQCRKVYWQATHVQAMNRNLERLVMLVESLRDSRE